MRTVFLTLALCFSGYAQSVSIGAPVFVGAGLNDATSGGRFTAAPANAVYVVAISATGTPDNFKWQKNGGTISAAIPITGAAQTIADGVSITFAATTGHTLAAAWTISATAHGSLHAQTFMQEGVGAVFRNAEDKARERLSAADFGAVGDGVTDDTASIQAAINQACNKNAPSCGEVIVGGGNFLLTSTVTIPTGKGTIFSGTGLATIFLWGGNNSTPMFSVQSCFSCFVANFEILVTSGHPLLYGIQQINSTASPRQTGTTTRYSHIFMEGTAGYLATGIYWGVGTDANNDQSDTEHVHIYNYGHSCFTLNNTQVVDMIFNHDVCAGFGQGQYGVEGLKGTYQWLGGDMAGNYTSDFLASNTGKGNTLIDSGSYEGSTKFAATAGPAYTYGAVTIRNVNFSGECTGATKTQLLAHFASGTACPSPGGVVISYQYSGTLSVQDSSFGIGLLTVGTTAAFTVSIQNFGAGFPTFGSFTNVGFFANTNTTVATIFPGAKPTNISSSFWSDGGTSYLPLELHPTPAIVPAVVTTWVANSVTQTAGTGLINQMLTSNTVATSVNNFGVATVPGAILEVYCNDSFTTWARGGGAGGIGFEGGPATSAAVPGKMYVFIVLLTDWILINK